MSVSTRHRAARRPLRQALAAVAAAVGLLAVVVAGVPTPPPQAVAAAPADRLPDLRMARIRDLRVQATSSGRRLLRFTTWIVNVGAGPFEVRGRRLSTSASTMSVAQRIYNNAGGYRTIRTPAVMRYTGDGHDHWHAQRIAIYELWSEANPTVVRRGAKVGFCFFDSNAYNLSLSRAPRSRRYFESSCGIRRSTSARMGISVGWADSYPWNFAYQWVDISGLKPGIYMLRVTVDKENWFRESNDRNNCNWSQIRIGRGSTVRVLAVGTNRCPAPPTPTPTLTPAPTPTPTPVPTG